MKPLRFILCLILLPLSIWYPLGVALLNLFFSIGLKHSTTPSVPTVGIGNLRMGGTGKTPHTEYLIRSFADWRTALLSRGYGRNTQGFVLADNKNASATSLGDEPAMMAYKFPSLTVAVCEERLEGVRHLMELPEPPEIIFLDDVYQHRALRPSVSILLTEYDDPYFHDFILPFGNLREFRSGRHRADIVVVTKCPQQITPEEQVAFRCKLRLTARQQLFFTTLDYGAPYPLFADEQTITETSFFPDMLLVTGIAHPDPLVKYLQVNGTVTHLRFSDHHNFTQSDCRKIRDTFLALNSNNKAIVTTEKDAQRMLSPETRHWLHDLPIYYIPIKVRPLNGDLKAAICSHLGETR